MRSLILTITLFAMTVPCTAHAQCGPAGCSFDARRQATVSVRVERRGARRPLARLFGR
jgi:hypothetical protein